MAAAVPPVVPPGILDLHTVLTVCGVDAVGDRNRLIAGAGFTSLDNFLLFGSDKDIEEMAKGLQSRRAQDGRVNLGIVHIKHLQALAWWIRDHHKRGLPYLAVNFTAAELQRSANEKNLEGLRVEAATATTVEKLPKFDPDDFDIHEDAFRNVLAQTFGVLREPLSYIARDRNPPNPFVDEQQRRMYQLPLAGAHFDADNRAVYQKLKAFLVNTPGWAWIERYDSTQNGREAFLAWTGHYNGEGELSKRTALAKSKLRGLHYKRELSMSFERYTELLTKCFATLDKDNDESYSERQKVEKLLEGFQPDSTQLLGNIGTVNLSFREDFSGACAFLGAEVARVYAPAMLERKKSNRKRFISAIHRAQDRGGRGRGRFGGRHGRGRGGGRGGGNGNTTQINGIDVSNPSRSFSPDEWNRLGYEGRQFVFNRRDNGGGRGRGGGRGGRGGDGRNASAVDTQQSGTGGSGQEHQSLDERGATNGQAFGRGAYGGRGGGRNGRS